MRPIISLAAIASMVAAPAGLARGEPAMPSPPQILIEREQYVPSGTFTTFRATGAQVLWVQQVQRGDVITVTNLEPTFPTYQHTVTACEAGCRALPIRDTPNVRTKDDGETPLFDTGVIAYAGDKDTIDTKDLAPGLFEYFCTLHPWMRGAFAVA